MNSDSVGDPEHCLCPVKAKRMLKIALIGHDSRNANLGVGALTVSDIEIIRRAAQKAKVPNQVTVLTGGGDKPSYVFGEDVVERFVRPLRKPGDFYKVVRAQDFVIDISGGDSFTDVYGHRRIMQDFIQKQLVHMAGRPLVFAPQTIGPFKHWFWRYLAKRSMTSAAILATRDVKSIAFLRELGVTREVIEASDVALRLPYEAPQRAPGGAPRVGLNVSGLLLHGGYTRNNMFGLKADYPKLIRELIKELLAHDSGCELHLIGHVVPAKRGGVEDDYQTCLDLAEEFPGAIVAPAFETPSEAKSYIAGLDFMVGARMHACIAAFSSGVPVVPMAYSRKFAGLFGSLDYNYTVDCTVESTEICLSRILEAYERREALGAEITEARARGQAKLQAYEDALVELMSERPLNLT